MAKDVSFLDACTKFRTVDCKNKPLLPGAISDDKGNCNLPFLIEGYKDTKYALYRYALVTTNFRNVRRALHLFTSRTSLVNFVADNQDRIESYECLSFKRPTAKPWLFTPRELGAYFPKIRVPGASFRVFMAT